MVLEVFDLVVLIQIGKDVVDFDVDILLLGEMGIGNLIVVVVLVVVIFGGMVVDWVGFGIGVDEVIMQCKIVVVDVGLKWYKGVVLVVLIFGSYGGCEQVVICGVVICVCELGILVILDGFICCVVVGVLMVNDRNVLDYCLIGYVSVELGYCWLIVVLKKEFVVGLDMWLGEGMGVVVVLLILCVVLECYNGMVIFVEVGIG